MSELVRLPPPFDRPLSEWPTGELQAWRARLMHAVKNMPMTDALKAEMAGHFNDMAHELKRRGLVTGEFKIMDIGLTPGRK